MVSDSLIERIVDWSSDGAVIELARELLQRREDARKTCKWEPESTEFMQPACKPSAFLKYDNTIRAGFKFCPYCGHPIEEAK